MKRQTTLELLYDASGNIRSGRPVTKSLEMHFDYYSKWFKDPTNIPKMIKVGNCSHYPGVQFPSYREFTRSATFKLTANKVAEDYVSHRTGWEIDRNTGDSIGKMVEAKHGWDWTRAWGKRFVRRVAKVLKANGMK